MCVRWLWGWLGVGWPSGWPRGWSFSGRVRSGRRMRWKRGSVIPMLLLRRSLSII